MASFYLQMVISQPILAIFIQNSQHISILGYVFTHLVKMLKFLKWIFVTSSLMNSILLKINSLQFCEELPFFFFRIFVIAWAAPLLYCLDYENFYCLVSLSMQCSGCLLLANGNLMAILRD